MAEPGLATTERRRSFEPIAFAIAVVSYVLWTYGVISGWADRTVDTWFGPSDLDPRSHMGQIAEAFALVTNPFLIAVIMAVLALRSFRRRQRHLAVAFLIALLGLPAWQINRVLIDRPRPPSEFDDSISAIGASYPSGHVLTVTIVLWVLVTVANMQRRSPTASNLRRALGLTLIVATCADQWAMNNARLSDMVGGWLFGAIVAAGALWVSGIHVLTQTLRPIAPDAPRGKRAAIIYNPTKVLELDLFHRRVAHAMAQAGWETPLWLETQRDDPGRGMAEDALAKGVDVVLVAGGDGTVRTVCAAMAHTGIPVAIIPAGTGNLLGRNLGVPLDEDEALDAALHGEPTPVDMAHWEGGGASESFVVMAGVGLDAQIMRDTDPRLKRVVRSGAYVVAGIRQVAAEPFHAKVTVDGRVVHDGKALMTLVGNVGQLQGGVNLLPEATPNDGRIHILIARGEGVRGMMRLVAAIRRDGPASPMRRFSGRRIDVQLDREVAFQLDGDAAGTASSFHAEAKTAALLVMGPRE
ncbi:diacylglycerol kinase family protein [Demequina gelatinilytica]|uniref:diacylglycerol kinase family protein n=1 Tax=Demequina gelatinilytica TaxID=1638980 RepID=UPI000783DDA3|nr:diacylglycerol kinase family protein [Demequina gelatinilytica]